MRAVRVRVMSARLAALAAQYVGRRIELAPHLDSWMRGDRFGTISRVTSRGFTVRLERSGRSLHGVTDDMVGRYVD